MALTVEELQIVLSCDATTAQNVLKSMEATVKAYTDKFQKYFDKMGSKNGPKDLASDVKAIEKTIGPVKKALGDIQRNEYKVGKMLSTEEMASQIAKNCAKATAETKAYFAKSEAEYQKIVNDVADNNQLIGLGAQMRGMLEDATGGIESMPEVLKYQVDQAAQSIKRLSEEYAKSVASSGENSKGSLAIKKKLEAAIVTADKLYQKLLKLQTVSQEGGGAVVPGGQLDGGDLEDTSSKLSTILSKASSVGHAIKKAFNHTILGKFLNRLRTVMMRMAAMALIRGVINGTRQGLEQLAKVSESSAKAMNTIKAAGGSIKMALGAAVMPIVKALAPVFVRLAGAISSASNALARFFAVVTGQSTYTAVSFSDSLDDVSDSATGAGKAVKGALADFDELIVIGKQAGGGGGGSTGVEETLSTAADLDAVSALGTRIRNAIERGDWRGVGDAIADKFNQAIANWDAAATAQKISTAIKNALDVALGLIEGIDFAQLGTKLYEFFRDFDYTGIAEKIAEGIGAALGSIGQFLYGILKGVFDDVIKSFNEASFDEDGEFDLSGMINWFINGANNLMSMLNPVKFATDHIVGPLLDGFVAALTNGEVTDFSDTLMDNIEILGTKIEGALGIALEWVKAFGRSVVDTGSLMWENLKSVFGIGWEYLVAYGKTVGDLASSVWETVKAVFGIAWEYMEAFGKTVYDLVSTIWQKVTSVFGIGSEYISALFTSISEYITANGTILVASAQKLANSIKIAILEKIQEIVSEFANGPVGSVLEFIGIKLSGAVDSLGTSIDAAKQKNAELDASIKAAQDRASEGINIDANVDHEKVDQYKKTIDTPWNLSIDGNVNHEKVDQYKETLKTPWNLSIDGNVNHDKVDQYKQTLNKPWDVGINARVDDEKVNQYKDQLKTPWKSFIQPEVDDKVVDAYKSALKTPWAAMIGVTLKEGTDKVLDTVKGAFDSVKDKTGTVTVNKAGNAKPKDLDKLATAYGKFKDDSTKNGTVNLTSSGDLLKTVGETLLLATITNLWSNLKAGTKKLKVDLDVDKTAADFVSGWNKMSDKTVRFAISVDEEMKAKWNYLGKKWNNSPLATAYGRLPLFAKGGIVYGPTPALVGEYAGASSNPEVIAPLSSLVKLLTKANAQTGGTSSEEEMRLMREQNAILRQLLAKKVEITPSVQLGQVIDRSQKLYART